MQISTLYLQNFRSFEEKKYEFSGGTTIIVGRNTSGKTNTLEAIYLLSSGKSFRANREEEMIRESESIGRVIGTVTHGEVEKLEVVLVGGSTDSRYGKRLLVNGVSRRLFGFIGTLKTVVFGPSDLGLVTDSPSIRRRFLDNVLSQTDREYRRSLLSYEKGIRQRNKVLERIREGVANRSQLIFWDQLLIKEGNYLTTSREKFIEYANSTSSIGEEFFLEYDRSVISDARLEEYKEQEVWAASTLVGPHRDDLIFNLSRGGMENKGNMGWELSKFGSRGEQRMAVLWIKLAELSYIEQESGERPVLLLDDIFSELDPEHHELVIETSKKQQTIVTTAERRNIEDWEGVQVIELGV